jgi:hypothetical protein
MDRGRTVELEHTRESEGPEASPDDERESRGRLARLGRRLPGPTLPRLRLSVRALLVATALSAVGVVIGGFLPVVGTLGRVAGLFVATFCYGLFSARSHYVAAGVGGAVAAVLGVVLSSVLGAALLPVLAGYGPEVAGVGATVGLLVALAGHYFGRDLRAGLTREI